MSAGGVSQKSENEQLVSVLMVGDVCGRSGRKCLKRFLPGLRERLNLDCIVVNGENASGGIGITGKVADEIFASGVDVITSGNHIWRYREIISTLESTTRLIRPQNYPPGTPGHGFTVFPTASGVRIGVMNLLGRIFMDPVDCPFRAADQILERAELGRAADMWLVDFHAEATSEKAAMASHLNGRVSAVVGTHTHVPTADHRILSNGTGFMTDLGMTGCIDSVIGMTVESVLPTMTTRMPNRFQTADGEGSLSGVRLTVEVKTGRCREIQPVRCGPWLEEAGIR
ncbi:MAG: TIGR00282 family metallophosphoesterase [Magnetococcales bacterium]|nr:TIGR00282 family metallophosphoesterase [Magnetococcales bacterium]